MAKFVILLLCLAVVHSSLALKCKRCVGDCKKMEDEECKPGTTQKAMCLIEKYSINDKEEFENKCVLVDKTKTTKYECVLPSGAKPITCDTCEKDFCNGAPSLGFGLVTVFGVVMALLVPKVL